MSTPDLLASVAGLSDIGYCTISPEKSICFPGPVPLGEARIPYVKQLTEEFLKRNIPDATINHLGATWRCHRDSDVVDGVWVRYRRTPDTAPAFGRLGVKPPAAVIEFLMNPEHNRGGLILILGAPGTGKTTTASATVVSRLEHFGGYCQTVEEPPEYPLNGWHERGYCTQTWVNDNGPNAWADAMKNALRSQAVGTPGMLFLGEVREDAAAKIALVAATNGFLVICTSFATSPESGISSFADRLEDSQLAMFSKMLRGVVYQNILREAFTYQLLVVDQPVELMIASKKYASIPGELQHQNNKRRLETPVNPISQAAKKPVSAPTQATLVASQKESSLVTGAAPAVPSQHKVGSQNMLFAASQASATPVAPTIESPSHVEAVSPLTPTEPTAPTSVSTFAAEPMAVGSSEPVETADKDFQLSGFVDSPGIKPKGRGWFSFIKK